MTHCDELRHAIGAYALGALDHDEAERVRRHIAECPLCAAEHDELAPLPDLLTVAGGAHAATADPLPPAFEERLLDAFAQDRARHPVRRRRLPRLRLHWPTLGAVAAAVAAVGAVLLFVSGGEEGPAPYAVAFESTAAAPAAHARAELESVPGGTELHLWVRNMPGDPRAVYEVLCEAPTWRASAGTFRVNTEGRAYVVLSTAARRGEYDSIRVVRRARDGSGEIVTRSVLHARLS
jgi:Putative zinc-finger